MIRDRNSSVVWVFSHEFRSCNYRCHQGGEGLWQNLPPTHNLTDAATVMRFRELVRSQAIRSVLERSNDTLLAFSLRAVERVVSDQSRTNRETINRLWDVLDDPHLNRALGIPQNSRTFRRSRF